MTYVSDSAPEGNKNASERSNELIQHVKLIHSLAKPLAGKGKLIVASYGQDPETGIDLKAQIKHVKIGDVDGMVAAIRSLKQRHRNVYVSLAIMRPDLPHWQKGEEGDIVGVMGFVGDFDDADAEDYTNRLPVPPCYTLETSEGHFQPFIFLDKVASFAEAKPIAQRLKAFARCDHGTADCSHVWRVPGILNWPNRKKVVEYGRSPEPQLVRVAEAWDGTLVSLADLDRLLPPIEEPAKPIKANVQQVAEADNGALPDWLIDEMKESFPVGQRSEHAFHVLCELVERGWSDSNIIAKISAYPSGVGERYVGEAKKLAADIKRARDKAKGDQQKHQYNGHSYSGSKKANIGANKQQPAGKAEQSIDDWPDPVPLKPAIPPAPMFPRECLPAKIANMIDDEVARSQSPPDLLAIPVIVTLAGCIGKDAAIRPKAKDDWQERPCHWAMLIGIKGVMKTPAIMRATAPLRRMQAMWSKEDQEKKAAWLALKADADMRIKAWENQCRELMKKAENGYDCELPPKPRALEELPEEPTSRRLVTQDPTLESLVGIMQNSRGLTLVRDELAGFMLNMSRYNAGSDRQFYLECHSGGSYTSDRVGRGEVTVSDLYLNIVGGIQPSVARKLFSVEDSADDGFFERFGLMSFPDLPEEWELVDRYPDTALRNAYNEICERLGTTNWATTLHTDAQVEAGQAKPYARFSSEAQEIFNDWLTEHMRQIRRAGEGPTEGFENKKRGLLARLALTIHLAAWASGEENDPRTVSAKSLSRALVLVEEYLVPTWHRVLAAFGKSKTETAAMRIAKAILAERLQGIRISDVLKRDWAGLKERAAIEAAFSDLVARDWLAPPERQTGPRGGRPSETYHVNPRVFEMEGHSHG